MKKEEIINEVLKYYPLHNEKSNSAPLDYYKTPEIQKLKSLLKERYNQNEWFLNIPKWFVLEKWPKPIFTRQANVQDIMWPYFSIWIHDFVKGEHYTISASHIIPYFLIYKWKNKDVPIGGLDYFSCAINREEYFENLIFEGFNPNNIIDIDTKKVEQTYLKYLGVKLFTEINILNETIPKVHFENITDNVLKISDLFDGISKFKLHKPYLDELGSGFL